MALMFAGATQRAIEVVHAYMRLDPFYVPYASLVLAYAHYMLGAIHARTVAPTRFVSQAPTWWAGRSLLAATLARMGHLDEARAEAVEALRLAPNVSSSGFRPLFGLKNERDEDHLFDGLRKAGLPE